MSISSSPTKQTLDQATLDYLNHEDSALIYNPPKYECLSNRTSSAKKKKRPASSNSMMLVSGIRNQSRVGRITIRPKTAKLSV